MLLLALGAGAISLGILPCASLHSGVSAGGSPCHTALLLPATEYGRLLQWVFHLQLGKAFPWGKHSFYQDKGSNTKPDSFGSLAPVIILLGKERGEHSREFPVLLTLHIWSPKDPSRKCFPNLGWGSLLLTSNFPVLQDYRTLQNE